MAVIITGISHPETDMIDRAIMYSSDLYVSYVIYIQNHPSVLIYSAIHHEVFTAGAQEARVCRAPSGKTEKSCYNPLRLETVIVLLNSSGIDFVNTPRLYGDQATR